MNTLTKEQFDKLMQSCYDLACQTSGAVDELLHHGFFQDRNTGGCIMLMVQKSLEELHEKIGDIWSFGVEGLGDPPRNAE